MFETLTQRHLFVSLPLLLICVSLLETAYGQCTICKNAQQVPLPDKILAIPGFPALPCGTVDSTLAYLLPDETSTECGVVHSLGSMCGCPVREDGCSLCVNGEIPGFTEKQLPDFMSEMFLGFAPTCEILNAHLRSLAKDESLCVISHSFISDYCGCSVPPGDANADEHDGFDRNPCSLCPDGGLPSQPDRNITIGEFEFGTCAQFEEALSLFLKEEDEECSLLSQAYASLCGCNNMKRDSSCSLCRDGSPMTLPEKPLDMFKDQFGGLVPTCEVYESFAAGFDQDSHECSLTRLYGSACGCPPVEDHCEICPGESMPEDHLNKTVREFSLLYDGFTATCFEAESYLQYQIPGSSDECFYAHHANFLCGCSDGIFPYLGADTRSKQAGLAWAPRVAAILSFIGSLFIIQDILKSKKKRSAVYSQLVLGMSFFDLIGAIAWGLSTLMIPTESEFAEYIYGVHGNNATCKLQGFMIQLNFTAILYNISLSTYYFLVIVHGWRDRRLQRNRWWLYGVPLSTGTALAFGGLPFYKNGIYGCYIQNPPVEETWYPIVFFCFVPIFSAIIFTTGMMMRVYFKVRQQNQRAARWRLSGRNLLNRSRFDHSEARAATARQSSTEVNASSDTHPRQAIRGGGGRGRGRGGGAIGRLQREVFSQSLFYLSAFYLSWTFLLAATLIASPSLRDYQNLDALYPFFVTALFLAPLQGFWNAAIYLRPRLLSRWSKHVSRRERTSEATSPTRDSESSSGCRVQFSRRRGSSSANSENDAQDKTDTGVGDTTSGVRGEDFDPSNEIAFLTCRSEQTTDCSISYDGASMLPGDRDAIREELEELDGAQDRIEDFEAMR